MNLPAILWFLLMLVFLFAEASTVVMVSLWFAVGALAAMIASLLGAEFWLQAVIFVAVSGILLALLRPVFRKYIKPKLAKTNLDAVIGATGISSLWVKSSSALWNGLPEAPPVRRLKRAHRSR